MAGKWTLITEGLERRLRSEELVALFDRKEITRFARVKRDPDGEWMPAERAVAIIRKQARSHSPQIPERPAEEPVSKPGRRGRFSWTMSGGILALLMIVVTVGVLARSSLQTLPVTDAPPAKEPAVAEVPINTDQQHPVQQRTTAERVAAEREGDSSSSTAAATGAPAEEKPGAAVPTSPIVVAETPELPSLLPYGDESVRSSRQDVTDVQVAEFIASVERQKTTDRSSSRIDDFLQRHRLTQSQSVQLGDLKRRFADREKRGLVRMGAKWVTPAVQQAAQAEANQLIQQAFALTDLGSIKSAEKLLLKASEVDGNNIEADLILGTWKGIVHFPDADTKGSEAHFETVLKRAPDHIGALNNSAVAEVRQKHYSQALEHLARAAELAPRCPEVVQNLGRLSMLAADGRITMTQSERDRCAAIYSRAIAGGRGTSADPHRGYLLLPPYVSPADRHDAPSTSADLVLISQGSGFVVAPEMVLTNRHVVTMEDDVQSVADEVRVVVERSDRSTVTLNGTVKAVCLTHDLALVHIPRLEATPLPVRDSPTRLADEIAILGFPLAADLGADLKFVSGRVGAQNAERLMFDCVANQGNSGGPVMSRNGDVVAVYNAVGIAGQDVVTQFGMGVPSPAAVRFVKEQLGAIPTTTAVGGAWPGIVSRVRSSVFKLDVYYRSSHPAILRTLVASAGATRWLEDPSCPTCSGRGAVVCPGGCVRGGVQEMWTEQRTGTLFGRSVVIPQLVTNVTSCKVCSGKGAVRCPDCINGVDPALRR